FLCLPAIGIYHPSRRILSKRLSMDETVVTSGSHSAVDSLNNSIRTRRLLNHSSKASRSTSPGLLPFSSQSFISSSYLSLYIHTWTASPPHRRSLEAFPF